MRTSLVWCAAALACAPSPLFAQQSPANGPRAVHAGWHALVFGTAITAPGNVIEDATIVIRDGRIVSVRAAAGAPAGARVWDCRGMTIYAGLVEPYCAVAAPAPDPKAPGTHWSPKIVPQRHVLDGAGMDAPTREALRKLGFCAVAIAPQGGIFAGTSAVVSTGDRPEGEGERVLRDRVYQAMAFDQRGDGYPGSEMGVIAAMRQAFADADWHAAARAAWRAQPAQYREPERADALVALDAQRGVPLLFDCQDELELLRADKVARESGRTAIVLGSGLEFRRVGAVAAAGRAILLPVDFPKAPDVSTVSNAERTSLRDLMTWEQAPTNARRLRDKGVKVAFTTARLEKRDDFFKGVRKAIAAGLEEGDALAMLTTWPAEILGIADRVGTIAAGKSANLVVVEGKLFDEKAKIRSVWVEGRHHVVSRKRHDVDGVWTLALRVGQRASLTVNIDGEAVEVAGSTLPVDGDDPSGSTTKAKASKVSRRDRHLAFVVDGAPLGLEGKVTMGGHFGTRGWFGRGQLPDGTVFQFAGTRSGDLPAKPAADKKGSEKDGVGPDGIVRAADATGKKAPRPLPLPFGAYGLTAPPPQEDLLFVGATVWTSGKEGNIDNGAVWIKGGKVAWVGPANAVPADVPAGTRRVQVTGKHITPGLLDCHSHTGISRGINESRQTVTSEVRVADVVDPDDIGWYRELAGGLTAANQLHGSANPIGGQNHVAKLRWGVAHPDEMSLRGAPGGIKFALGENPKRRGESGRYPGSRLGVEALIRDRFVAAREYDAAWRRHRSLAPGGPGAPVPPRRDLELEAIAEILRGERLVHCHSYRQDEIFMLCRMADEFGFKLGTLQHVLEGYKVAEAIRKSALGASSFSDWWAYKLEVIDAIPFNGAIMHEVGVVVSFNSDSSELARRMNTEAGKAVKYGGVEPAEALKFVTLNPAIQLGVQARVGSLEQGKDADLVVWSADPLSYRARCLATYIDGRAYFTVERDRELRAEAARERTRLLQLALAAKEVAPPRSGRGRRRSADRYNYVDELYSCCQQEAK